MKDPAYLFYSQDFYTGVATMNFEDRGKYITILCLMHQQGRMNEETIRFVVGSISVNLKNKFRIDENGLWYNERLELEIEKRKNFVESRVNNGKLGGRPKDKQKPLGKPKQNRKVNLPEDENGNENNLNKEGDFFIFWSAYPKKKSKDDALKAWKNKINKPPIAEILLKLEIQKKSNDWLKDNGQFIPYPATYINRGSWHDEIKTEVNGTKLFPKERTEADILREKAERIKENEKKIQQRGV